MARIEPAMTALVVRKEYRSTRDPVYHDESVSDAPALPQGVRADDRERSLARKQGRSRLHSLRPVPRPVRSVKYVCRAVPERAPGVGCCATSGQVRRAGRGPAHGANGTGPAPP